MVGGANVLGVACNVWLDEFFTNTTDWDTQLVAPVLNWLTNNPTKHPEYIILFYDIPMRLWLPGDYGCGGVIPYSCSVSFHLQQSYPGWQPFVNNINQGTIADCEAYIDKLAHFGTNYSPGKLIISANTGGYTDTNYMIDDANMNFCFDTVVPSTTNGLIAAGVSPLAISYLTGCENTNNLPHINNATNVAGYICWGEHSSLGQTYAIDGTVKWTANSGWWIIETIESFNGQRYPCAQGNFIQWFSSNAFGGTNYSNTPIGAVSHTEEPGGPTYCEDPSIYFGLWADGKNFAICSWNSRRTPHFQAVGDPFVTK
jgi:hypothetical protein